MSKVDLFVHGQLSKNGYFTCIFGVVHYPIILIINLIPLYVKKCVHYRTSDKTEEGSQMLSLYRFLVRAGTRPLIKDGEIGEDSKAAPQKLVYQYMAKK